MFSFLYFWRIFNKRLQFSTHWSQQSFRLNLKYAYNQKNLFVKICSVFLTIDKCLIIAEIWALIWSQSSHFITIQVMPLIKKNSFYNFFPYWIIFEKKVYFSSHLNNNMGIEGYKFVRTYAAYAHMCLFYPKFLSRMYVLV